MSQITRCPVCETMFKVVAKQFEAAQGWVRCGYCGEVFDAAQHLVQLDPAALGGDAAAPVVPAVPVVQAVPDEALQALQALEALPASGEPHASEVVDGLPVSSSPVEDVTPALTDDPLDSAPVAPKPAPQEQPAQGDKPEPEPVGGAQALPDLPQPLQTGPTPLQPLLEEVLPVDALALPVAPAGAQAMPAAPQDEESGPAASSLTQAAEAQTQAVAEAAAVDINLDIGALHPAAASTPPVEAEVAAVQANPVITPLAALAEHDPAPAPEPSFVRDARRRAFWKRPLVRALLGLVFLLLLTALLLQWVLQQKDNLAATDPRLAPFLQALCGPLNCTIRPPRRIESLVIDSSSFRKTGPDMYSLSFVLKNNSAAVLEMPSLEVTLTDVQEQALVRRVLAPREFGATAAALAAHGELAGVVTLKVAGEPVPGAPLSPPLPVTGYRVVAFYP